MPTLTGINRGQIVFSNLECKIAQDNEIRFINAFVDKLDFKQPGIQSRGSTITLKRLKQRGYESLLKVYIIPNPSICEPLCMQLRLNDSISFNRKLGA